MMETGFVLLHLGSDEFIVLTFCTRDLSVQKHKKKKKVEVFNFSAIHLIHDPQGRLPSSSP